jgi:hypothetical protein
MRRLPAHSAAQPAGHARGDGAAGPAAWVGRRGPRPDRRTRAGAAAGERTDVPVAGGFLPGRAGGGEHRPAGDHFRRTGAGGGARLAAAGHGAGYLCVIYPGEISLWTGQPGDALCTSAHLGLRLFPCGFATHNHTNAPSGAWRG